MPAFSKTGYITSRMAEGSWLAVPPPRNRTRMAAAWKGEHAKQHNAAMETRRKVEETPLGRIGIRTPRLPPEFPFAPHAQHRKYNPESYRDYRGTDEPMAEGFALRESGIGDHARPIRTRWRQIGGGWCENGE